jgi:hypothetical protein
LYVTFYFAGKINNQPQKNQCERVVLDLGQHLDTGYGITVENFFTVLQLAEKLLDRNMTLCGTLRRNKKCIIIIIIIKLI